MQRLRIFVLPSAIYAGNGRHIARHFDGVISAGYLSTLGLRSLAHGILFDEQFDGKPRSVGVKYSAANSLYLADSRYDSSKTSLLKTERTYAPTTLNP
jgi:hypothetical protein